MKPVFPEFLEPMMASIAKEPFNHPDWIYETKLDGYRAIAVVDSASKARIWSRNRLPLELKFPTAMRAKSWREDKSPEEVVLEARAGDSPFKALWPRLGSATGLQPALPASDLRS